MSFTKNSTGKKKVVLVAERLQEMQHCKTSLRPPQREAAVRSLISDAPFPCAASETRRFCRHRLDADKTISANKLTENFSLNNHPALHFSLIHIPEGRLIH